MRKGVSPIISTIILILITISATFIVISIGRPTIDRAYEAAIMNEVELNMQLLDNLIREVASEGTGSLRSVILKVSDGDYRLVNASGNFTGALQFKIGLKHSPFAAPMLKKVGNLKYTAGMNSAGLVGYWKLDEVTGSSASDSSGYNNDGTLYNGPTWVDGKFGKALSFDGVDDYVNVPHSTSLDVDVITVAAWVKGTFGSDYRDIIGKSFSGADRAWALCINNGKVDWNVASQGSAVWDLVAHLGTAIINDNKWHFVVAVYDGVRGYVYVDGALDSSGGSAGVIGKNTLYLGVGRYYGGEYLNGIIDEVRIYNRALSEEEIKENYDSKASNYQVVLEYGKIVLTGNLKLGKGTHKICIEKIGELNNKPLVKITIC